MRHISAPTPFRLFGILTVIGAALGVLAATGCSSARLAPEQEACRVMRAQIKEKQELDARVKSLAKQVSKYRKQGDTAAAAAADSRLRGLVENQRYLKESLERSSSDCTPLMKDDYAPVLDPARRDRLEVK
jgi:cell division protein FtsB